MADELGAVSEGSSAVRPENVEEILAAILASGSSAVAREEIVAATGLARGTVMRGFRTLEVWNAALDPAPLEFTLRRTRTKAARRVAVAPDRAYVVGVDFSHRRATVAVGNAYGDVMRREDWRSQRMVVDADPHRAFSKAAEWARELTDERSLSELVGVGVAVAAPVDPVSGRVRALRGEAVSGFSSWVGLDPADELRQRLYDWSVTFFAGNDANFAALSEYRALRRIWRQGVLMDMLHLKWSSGIGGGVVVGGRIHAGFRGLAGELGHSPVLGLARKDRPHDVCERCGKLVCLENVCSYEAIKRYLARESGDKSFLHMPRLEVDMHPEGRAYIEHVAIYIGRALGAIVNLFNPQSIVISGPSHRLHPLLIPRTRRGIAESAVPAATSKLDVRVAERRWPEANDAEGRLVVAHGAMLSVLDEAGVPHLLARLTREEVEAREPRGTVVAFARSDERASRHVAGGERGAR